MTRCTAAAAPGRWVRTLRYLGHYLYKRGISEIAAQHSGRQFLVGDLSLELIEVKIPPPLILKLEN